MEILEEVSIYTIPDWVWIFVILAIGFFILALTTSDHLHYKSSVAAAICGIFSCMVFLYGICFVRIDTGRKKYIVRLNDTASVNELYENYEIIKKDKYSNIYTIEDKE